MKLAAHVGRPQLSHLKPPTPSRTNGVPPSPMVTQSHNCRCHAHSPIPPLATTISTAVLCAALSLLPVEAQTVSGAAKVVDGDTLVIGDERIRLFGIDAPESAQKCKDSKGSEYACGQEAKAVLERKVGGQPVTCDVKNKDMYGRNVSVCYSGPQAKDDLNAFMVSQGEAVAYTQYSKAYVPEADAAAAAKKGIWSGQFQAPAEWRKDNPRGKPASDAPPPTTTAPDSRCSIKGNISSSGEKIFHSPGGRYYDSTIIDVGSGERWFCSAADAEKAGWRASKA